MDKNKLKRYSDLKLQEKALKAQMSILNSEILQMLNDENADKIESDFGVFTLVPKKTWKFSDSIDTAKKNIKMLQEEEQADGTATYTESHYLMFKEQLLEIKS